MTASSNVKQYIADISEGQVFPSASLRPFASSDNIRQILNRLVKSGELKRVTRGIFVKPKQVSTVGEVLPSASEVTQMLANSTGEIIAIHGAEAARQLQLTTQVPMRPIFYTSGNTRTLKMANRTVILKHVNPSKLIATGTVQGLVISALCYLGQEQVTIQIIASIKERISAEAFQATLHLIERMPAWLANVFYHYRKENVNNEE